MNGPCQIVSLKNEKHNKDVRLKEIQNNNSTNRKSNFILIMILAIDVYQFIQYKLQSLKPNNEIQRLEYIGSHLLNMVLLNENIDLNEHKVTQNISARRIMFTKGIQSLKKGIRYFCHNNVCLFFF